MYFVNYVLVLTFLAVKARAGYSQYFYSSPVRTNYFPQTYQPFVHHQPITHQQYQQPFFPSPYAALPTPAPQPTQYFHSGFNYQHPQALFNVQPVQDYRIPNVQRRVSPLPQQQEHIQNYETTPVEDNFRGFAYQTEYEQGGRSSVVFITGPEVNKFRSANTNTRTTASDAVDSNFNKEESSQASKQNESIKALVNFLQNPQAGIRKFYSVNNELVARNYDEDINAFPANTLPLREPISPIFTALRSSFDFSSKNTDSSERKEDSLTSATRNYEEINDFSANTLALKEPISPIFTALRSGFDSSSKNTDASEKKDDSLPSASERQAATTSSEVSTTEARTETTSTTTTVAITSTSTTTIAPTSRSTMAPIVVEDDVDSTEEPTTTES